MVTISTAGSDTFGLSCSLEQDVVEMEVTVEYDPEAFRDPVVLHGVVGKEVQIDSSAGSSGSVWLRISSSAPLKRNWMPARIRFARQGEKEGTVTALHARLSDMQGRQVPVETKVVNPEPGKTGQETTEMPRHATLPVSSITPSHTDAVSRGGTGVAATQRSERQPGVLDRFRATEKSAPFQVLVALFGSGGTTAMRQTPSVVLSDGQRKLRLTVRTSPRESTPRFVLHKARCISLRQGRGGEWVIEALPDKGTLDASLTVVTDTVMTEYPLTVAPPLDPSRPELSEADFALYRKGRGKTGNKGKTVEQDAYLKDYLYVANFLAQGTARNIRVGGPPRRK